MLTEDRMHQVELVAADLVEALHEERLADVLAHIAAAEHAGWARALMFTLAGLLAVQYQVEDTIAAWRQEGTTE